MTSLELSTARLVPLPGTSGWLVRRPGFVFWAGSTSQVALQLVRQCLSSERPAEALALLSRGVADPDAREWPPFVALLSRPPELVVLVHGPVEVGVEPGGQAFSGGDGPGAWSSRALAEVEAVRVGGSGMAAPDAFSDLGQGTVAAGGFLLLPGEGMEPQPESATAGPAGAMVNGSGGEAPSQEVPSHGHQPDGAGPGSVLATPGASPPSATVGGPSGVPERREPFDYQAAGLAQEPTGFSGITLLKGSPTVAEDATVAEGPRRQASAAGELTLVDVPPRPSVVPGSDRHRAAALVLGVYCPSGHFNDPRLRSCRRCGARLASDAPEVEAPRPPIGALSWDDGETSLLGAAALVGRDVGHDPAVAAGQLAPVVPRGVNDSMSRLHAEIRAEGWDVVVVDRGSTNGTFVWDDGARTWQRLVPGEPQVVLPGAVLAFGERTATLDG